MADHFMTGTRLYRKVMMSFRSLASQNPTSPAKIGCPWFIKVNGVQGKIFKHIIRILWRKLSNKHTICEYRVFRHRCLTNPQVNNGETQGKATVVALAILK